MGPKTEWAKSKLSFFSISKGIFHYLGVGSEKSPSSDKTECAWFIVTDYRKAEVPCLLSQEKSCLFLWVFFQSWPAIAK